MKCKYNYDGQCNLKYCKCEGICEDFIEDKYTPKQEY